MGCVTIVTTVPSGTEVPNGGDTLSTLKVVPGWSAAIAAAPPAPAVSRSRSRRPSCRMRRIGHRNHLGCLRQWQGVGKRRSRIDGAGLRRVGRGHYGFRWRADRRACAGSDKVEIALEVLYRLLQSGFVRACGEVELAGIVEHVVEQVHLLQQATRAFVQATRTSCACSRSAEFGGSGPEQSVPAQVSRNRAANASQIDFPTSQGNDLHCQATLVDWWNR